MRHLVDIMEISMIYSNWVMHRLVQGKIESRNHGDSSYRVRFLQVFAQTKSRNLRNMQANREQKMMAILGLN